MYARTHCQARVELRARPNEGGFHRTSRQGIQSDHVVKKTPKPLRALSKCQSVLGSNVRTRTEIERATERNVTGRNTMISDYSTTISCNSDFFHVVEESGLSLLSEKRDT